MKHSAYGVGFYCFMLFFFSLFPFKSEDMSVQHVLKQTLCQDGHAKLVKISEIPTSSIMHLESY